MLNKLAFRNAKRSARDYFVYLITMTIITALMFAFNTMLFSEDVQSICKDAGLLAAMIGIATFFIIWIIQWLIHYMVRFILEKKSREFATYLLLGMKKKQIARLYMKENVVIGCMALLLGLFVGIFLQQILMTIFYGIMDLEYHLNVSFNKYCLLMTLGCYIGIYALAIFRNKKRFKKMNIIDLMNMDKQNERIKEGGESVKQWIFFLAIGFIVTFYLYLFRGNYSWLSMSSFIIGFIIAIYLIYVGFAAFLVNYVKKGGSRIYKGMNVFLFRQLSSKIKTMRFTMGTLSVLFAVALFGCTFAMMFSDYQNKQLENQFPFAVSIHRNDVTTDFSDEISRIQHYADISRKYAYHVYHNGTDEMNAYLYTHLQLFRDQYKLPDGSLNREELLQDVHQDESEYEFRYYYDYDTYMKLGDYNHLRNMLGYPAVSLGEDEYLIQIKNRLLPEMDSSVEQMPVHTANGDLHFAGFYTEDFCQNGHNGADYIFVVPDDAVQGMTKYYSQLVVDTDGGALNGLSADLLGEGEDAGEGYGTVMSLESGNNIAFGTDQIIVHSSEVLVRSEIIPEMRFLLTAISFPLMYIGLVFVCVALTILSVQQLSDSHKYKFRYSILNKLGLKEREIDRVILKQLFWYYLCPILVAVTASVVIALFASERFIHYTGVRTNVFWYYGTSLVVFLGVYLIYFVATYVMFKRNVYQSS